MGNGTGMKVCLNLQIELRDVSKEGGEIDTLLPLFLQVYIIRCGEIAEDGGADFTKGWR